MKDEYEFSKGKRGAILSSKGKTRITIYLDDAILEEFRSRVEEVGTGYQTMINEALNEYLSQISESNWEAVDNLSDEEVLTLAESDPDVPPTSAGDLQKFHRVTKVKKK